MNSNSQNNKDIFVELKEFSEEHPCIIIILLIFIGLFLSIIAFGFKIAVGIGAIISFISAIVFVVYKWGDTYL